MSETLRYPIEQMHAAAGQIAAAAGNMAGSTATFWLQAQDSTTSLPPSVRDGVQGCLAPLHEHLLQLLALHDSLADHLNATADLAAATEQGATGAFAEKP